MDWKSKGKIGELKVQSWKLKGKIGPEVGGQKRTG